MVARSLPQCREALRTTIFVYCIFGIQFACIRAVPCNGDSALFLPAVYEIGAQAESACPFCKLPLLCGMGLEVPVSDHFYNIVHIRRRYSHRTIPECNMAYRQCCVESFSTRGLQIF